MSDDPEKAYSDPNVYPLAGRMGERARPSSAVLSGGSGDGTSGMEPRVAKLEADVGHIKDRLTELRSMAATLQSDVSAIKVDVARLTERIAHLPGRGFIVTSTVTALALLAGLLVFGRRLLSL